MKLFLFLLLFSICSTLRAQKGYVILNNGQVIKGMIIDVTAPNLDNHKRQNDLIIKTEVNGKNTKLHFGAEDIKSVVMLRRKNDSLIYKPLQFRDDTFLCRIVGTKGKASIFYWFWDTGEVSYSVNGTDISSDEVYEMEYILVSNDSIIEINPRYTKPKFHTFPRIPNKEEREMRREMIKKMKKKPYQTDDELLLQFINKRYNQHFTIKDFKTKNIQNYSALNPAEIFTSKTTQNLLNYIVNAENNKLSKN